MAVADFGHVTCRRVEEPLEVVVGPGPHNRADHLVEAQITEAFRNVGLIGAVGPVVGEQDAFAARHLPLTCLLP